MKTTTTFLLFLSLSLGFLAQDCVDSTLIDLNSICTQQYAPVCGCNGVTYDNDCYATYYGGVTSWTDGPCQNTGCMNMGEIDFGMCDMFMGYAWTGEGCSAISGCGYIVDNIDYSPNFFQDPSDCQESCGDPLHDCINWSQIEMGYLVDCAPTTEQVCGCNGVSYTNNCEAYYIGGVTSYALGSCDDSLCFVVPIYVDFGECAMPLGYANNGSGCVQYSGCSYIGQNGYDYSEYFYETFYQCSGACVDEVVLDCVDSTQIDLTMMCTAEYDPVCGCNDVTYSNSCAAYYYGGVTSWVPGACATSVVENHETEFRIYPNPARDFIRLEFVRAEFYNLVINDITGRNVLAMTVNGSFHEIPLSGLAPGVYQITVFPASGKTSSKKFIIEP